MKIKFIISIIIITLISSNSFALPRCENLYNAIYNENQEYDVAIDTIENQKTIGIRLKRYWNEDRRVKMPGSEYLTDDGLINWPGWSLVTTKDGYFKVGKITQGVLASQIKIDDIILSINDIDIRNIFSDKNEYSSERDVLLYKSSEVIDTEDISDLFKKNELIKFKLLREENGLKKEIIVEKRIPSFDKEPNIINYELSYNEPDIDFFINSIEVNEKNGFIKASIQTKFTEHLDSRYFLTKEIWKNIVDEKEYVDGKLQSFYWEQCVFSEERWKKLNSVDPAFSLKFYNQIKEDRQTRTSEYLVKPKFTRGDLAKGGYKETDASVTFNSNSFYQIKNEFKLENFPFDRQKIKIFLYNDKLPIESFRSKVTKFTMQRALDFKDKNDITGWNITGVSSKYEIFEDPTTNDEHDGFSIILDIERKSGYYIFKIIIPIFLILAVCWSSIWISPREIESRLTITIVCLLSLIAYNFVIDSELPKLEYLTIMDYIILISYVYATIPNFLSIISFNLYKKNKITVSDNYETLQKKYGLPSYLIVILIIIIFNTSSNPENTSSMLTWATFGQ